MKRSINNNSELQTPIIAVSLLIKATSRSVGIKEVK